MTELKRRRRRAAPAGIAPNEPERDILDQYLYEVSTYPLLKGTEEIELAKKIRAGDPDALQELVKRNLRFVISVAKKYQNRGLPLIDLIGEGNVGLLTAARKFDPDQGVKFISYAVWWIRQAILQALVTADGVTRGLDASAPRSDWAGMAFFLRSGNNHRGINEHDSKRLFLHLPRRMAPPRERQVSGSAQLGNRPDRGLAGYCRVTAPHYGQHE
jgi:RNA polymerase sigma factor (sigma-70 family)